MKVGVFLHQEICVACIQCASSRVPPGCMQK